MEKQMGNSFSAFFDFICFENLCWKAKQFCAERVNKQEKELNLENKNKGKELNFSEQRSNRNKDDIDIHDDIVEEAKESDQIKNNVKNFDCDVNLNNDFEINKANLSKSGYADRKNLMFTTIKISKNHFKKGASGKLY